MRPPKTIETAHLYLRSPVLQDAETLFNQYAQDPEVIRYLTWKPHISSQQTETYLHPCVAGWEEGIRFPWVITLKGSQSLMGMVELHFEYGDAIGYVLGVKVTTGVMNAVNVRYVGAASGVNNAVSCIASLLAIALYCYVKTVQPQSEPAQRTATTSRYKHNSFLESQRVNLAAAAVPPGLSVEVAAALKSVITAAFVDGFRLVMGIAVGLAIASAITAALMIERRSKVSP